jgi:hypothetical protein
VQVLDVAKHNAQRKKSDDDIHLTASVRLPRVAALGNVFGALGNRQAGVLPDNSMWRGYTERIRSAYAQYICQVYMLGIPSPHGVTWELLRCGGMPSI